MRGMGGYLLVFVGGGLGAAARHGANRLALAIAGPGFPAGTLVVNALGCFAMGLLAGWLALRDAGSSNLLRLFLATGLLGGFTTFSAFSLDALTLWQRGQAGLALAYVAASLLLALLGVVGGLALVRAL